MKNSQKRMGDKWDSNKKNTVEIQKQAAIRPPNLIFIYLFVYLWV